MVIIVNLFLGLSPGIDNWGHLGGLIGGFLFSWFLGPTFTISQGLFGENVIIKDEKKILLAIGLLLTIVVILAAFGFLFRSTAFQ